MLSEYCKQPVCHPVRLNLPPFSVLSGVRGIVPQALRCKLVRDWVERD